MPNKDIFGNIIDNDIHGNPDDKTVTGERTKDIHGKTGDKTIWGEDTDAESDDGTVWG